MVTSIARQSVILKCNMQKAVMLGNYEFYYGAGVAGKIGGFEIPDDIKPLELRELLDKKLDQIRPKDEKETYLIHILKEFRPDELYDGQMKELLLWGKGCRLEFKRVLFRDYHVEIGSNLYHICEFAERMEYGGHTCEPVRDNLPERCYSVLSGSDEIIIIKRGEKGYFKTDIPVTDKDEARSIANEYNAKLGVSRAQEEAMKAGSMFGFQVPAADPRNYDADGKPVMPKNRGDAR